MSFDKLDPTADEATWRLYADTMEFLIAEGLATGRKVHDGFSPYKVRLTLRALTLLNVVPSAIAGTTTSHTWGSRVQEAVRTGSKEALNTVVRALLDAAVKYAMGGQ